MMDMLIWMTKIILDIPQQGKHKIPIFIKNILDLTPREHQKISNPRLF